jgi:hypothetical protein
LLCLAELASAHAHKLDLSYDLIYYSPIYLTSGTYKRIDCPRCGDFTISARAEATITTNRFEADRWKISAWLRDNTGVQLTSDSLERAVKCLIPSTRMRAERILFWLYRRNPILDYSYSLRQLTTEPEFRCLIAISWSRNEGDVQNLVLKYLGEYLNFIKQHTTSSFQLTATAVDYIENSGAKGDSSIAFCAMWFDASMSNIWNDAISPGISSAGWEPLRVDGVEHAGKIDDQIVASIRRSKFVVADFTGHRGGVYFEAGLAQGLGLPVIWTCREDEIKNLHFDIRQYNCIDWKSDDLPRFKERLKTRIEAVIGRGPKSISQ